MLGMHRGRGEPQIYSKMDFDMSDSSLSRLMSLAGQHKRRVVLSCVLAALSTGFAIAPYLLFFFALESYLASEIETFWFCIAGAVLSLFLRPLCFGLSTWIAHDAAFDTLHAVRLKLLGKLSRLPLGFFGSRRAGGLKRLVNENVEVLELFLSHQLPDMVSALVMPLATLLLLAVVDWRLALAAAGIIPIAWIANILMMRGHGDKIGQYFQKLSAINEAGVEYLQGIALLKTSGGGRATYERLERRVEDFQAFGQDWQKAWLGPWTLFSVATGASLLFVVPVGLILIQSGSATVNVLLFAILCATGIGAPIVKLMLYTEIFLRVQKAEESIDRLLKEPEIEQTFLDQGVPENFNMRFCDVSLFQNSRQLLSDINLEIPAGKVTAIVGPSGAGKTSLVRLMARHWDASGGRILLGEQDIRDYALEVVLGNIALISQDVFLFNASVLENIKAGQQDASLEEVKAAARAANADQFIEAMPEGYNSVVGENGKQLSGGERQRLSLARALLRNAPVLIMDEATAHLDPEHESLIQNAINRQVGAKTIIIVSHRLDSVKNCDVIALMHEGRVAAIGSHDELLTSSDLYKALWLRQTRNLEWVLPGQAKAERQLEAV